MSTKVKVIVAIVALAASFAAGRFLTPTKIKIETKIVEVEKKEKKTATDKKRRVTVVTVTKPDGTKEERKTIDTDSQTRTDEKTDKQRNEQTVSETTRSSGRLNLSVLGGVTAYPAFAPTFGGHVSKDIIGPVSIGVWGLSNLSGGVSVGLSF